MYGIFTNIWVVSGGELGTLNKDPVGMKLGGWNESFSWLNQWIKVWCGCAQLYKLYTYKWILIDNWAIFVVLKVHISLLHLYGSWQDELKSHDELQLQGTNISPTKALVEMILLFPRWDMWSFPGGYTSLNMEPLNQRYLPMDFLLIDLRLQDSRPEIQSWFPVKKTVGDRWKLSKLCWKEDVI